MGFATSYLLKHRFFKPFIPEPPHRDTSLIVVIPSFNEPDVIKSLVSLYKAGRPSFTVEIIVVVNSPEGADSCQLEQNRETIRMVKDWSKMHCSNAFMVNVIDVPSFPRKHAGAGFARKTGMDEAVHRFNLLNNDRGIIVSFDADSECDVNYFPELEKCFSNPGIRGCAIYFEHPMYDSDHSMESNWAIAGYELYLRYFVQAMRWAGFPYAFHTIGSCFAVNSKTYARQGGMNRKTAGEDFYFLHKIIPLGGFTELNSTRVIPSSRISDRVPFGTGASMRKLSSNGNQELQTYPLQSFKDLAELFSVVPDFFGADTKAVNKTVDNLPGTVRTYLRNHDFTNAVMQMNLHTAGSLSFRKRFFVWFNALRLLRFLNFAREKYNDEPVTSVAASLLDNINVPCSMETYKLLSAYRELQRQSVWRN